MAVSEPGRRRLLSASLAASAIVVLVSGSALLAAALTWPLASGWLRASRPASIALLAVLGADAALSLAVAVRSAVLALACRARGNPRKLRLLHPVSAHLVCLLLPSVLINLAVVVWCVVGMALSPRLSRSRLLWAALGYFETAEAAETMDETQSALECCGFDGPDDWHPWANDPIGRLADSVRDKQDGANAKDEVPATSKHLAARPPDSDIPESCCAVDSVDAPPTAVPGRAEATVACRVWERGCFRPLANALVVLHLSVGAACLVLAAMLVSGSYEKPARQCEPPDDWAQSLVAATLRLAQTSARTALESGDADGPAQGWLFRPPRAAAPHDDVAMATFSDPDDGPPKPGRRPRQPRHSTGRARGDNPFFESDSDPDQPDKLLFDRTQLRGDQFVEKAGRVRERFISTTSTTSIDSSLSFDLTETPLPTSEERFILAEYAYSLGPSLDTSTTSSWTQAEETDPDAKSCVPSPTRSPRKLRRVRSEGTLSESRLFRWEQEPIIPSARRAVQESQNLASENIGRGPRKEPHLQSVASPPETHTVTPNSIPTDREAILFQLEKTIVVSARLGAPALATTASPRPPARITSESSTQTNPAGSSMLQLDDLFREHGIDSRTESRTSTGVARRLPGTWLKRAGGGDVAANVDIGTGDGLSVRGLTTTASTSKAFCSESRRKSSTTSQQGEPTDPEVAGDVSSLEVSMPPAPDEVVDLPLPPPPLPPLRFSSSDSLEGERARRKGPPPSRRRGPPSSSGSLQSERVRRPRKQRARARRESPRPKPALRNVDEAVALWLQGSAPWLLPGLRDAGSGDSPARSCTTPPAASQSPSSNTSSPDPALPPPTLSPTSTTVPHSPTSSATRSTSSLPEEEEMAAEVEVTCLVPYAPPCRTPEVPVVTEDSSATCLVPYIHEPPRLPQSDNSISSWLVPHTGTPHHPVAVAASKTTVTVAIRRADRHMLCPTSTPISLPWLVADIRTHGAPRPDDNDIKSLVSVDCGDSLAPSLVAALRADQASVMDTAMPLPRATPPDESPASLAKTSASPPPPPPAQESLAGPGARAWSRGDTSLASPDVQDVANEEDSDKMLPGSRCRPRQGRARRGVAASKWARNYSRRNSRALLELLWSLENCTAETARPPVLPKAPESVDPSILPELVGTPGIPEPPDTCAASVPIAQDNGMGSWPAVRTADDVPVPGAQGASCPREARRKSRLTEGKRTVSRPRPSCRPPPRGSKRSRSHGSMPPQKVQAVMPFVPDRPERVESVPLRRTAGAASVTLASSSSDQCPLCDCWRRGARSGRYCSRSSRSPSSHGSTSDLRGRKCSSGGCEQQDNDSLSRHAGRRASAPVVGRRETQSEQIMHREMIGDGSKEKLVSALPVLSSDRCHSMAEETDDSVESDSSSLPEETTSALLLLARRFR